MKQKINTFFTLIIGIGMIGILLGGAASLIGYIVAMMIGGNLAVEICIFISKNYIPLLVQATSIMVGLGLISMYLNHNKLLTHKNNNRQI